MFGPLRETLKMEHVHAFGLAGRGGIPFHYFRLADGTNVLWLVLGIIFLLLLTDDLGKPLLG